MEEVKNSNDINFKKDGDKTDILGGFQQVFGLGNAGSSISPQPTTINEPLGGFPSPSSDELTVENYEEKNESEEEQSEGDEGAATPTGEEDEKDAKTQKESKSAEEEGKGESAKKPTEGTDATNNTRADATGEEGDGSGDNESEIVDSFFDLFSQELGWEVDENEKPKSIADLVSYMDKLVIEGSKPTFANEEIEKMNMYVSQGGKLSDYISALNAAVDYDNLDLSDVETQKRVIREQQKKLGVSDERIQSKIERYEDVGTLEDEAEEALELLKKYDEKEADKLLTAQANLQKEREKEQQNFINNVKSTIDSMKTIKGISLTEKQRQDLKSYLFDVDRQGVTAYQKDFAKSYNTLIESAFFTMVGDDVIKQLQRKADTDAAKNLKDRLNKSKVTKTKAQSSGSSVASVRSSTLDTVRRINRILSE